MRKQKVSKEPTKKTFFLLFSSLLFANDSKGANSAKKDARQKFPYDFEFGVTTAAYQTEGAWNVDGELLLFMIIFKLSSTSSSSIVPMAYIVAAKNLAFIKLSDGTNQLRARL